MRRGHSGIGGWRSDNPRPYRPRGNAAPNFRPHRPFGLLDTPRFPPPGPRQYRGPRPFSQHPGRPDNLQHSEYHDRNKFRINNQPRSQDRAGYHNRDRPYHHQPRQNDDQEESYGESNYYQNNNQCHVNNMGDIDHRRQQIPPWSNLPPAFENNRQYYDNHRSPHKTPRHFNLGDDLPDYTGHRPPASDHYATTGHGPTNNSQYSHSVDDTVDIIRKRLQNRDKQPNTDTTLDHENIADEDLRKNTNESYENVPQVPPIRKRTQRQKQYIKSNCNKMKNKIVHQLFKMDKTKIHKLMDDPSSSSKFEYAISSLITEGQNSLNKHLRSAAEKSLCSSSTDFIHDDTNTIYEDTFMKQMQGVLDPQDTVLLEDIKPLVMAELSRVLQLDDYQFELLQEQGYQIQGMPDNEMNDQQFQNFATDYNEMYPRDQAQNSQYYDDMQNTEQFSQDSFYHGDENQVSEGNHNNVEVTEYSDNTITHYEPEPEYECKPLFERRPASKVDETAKRRSAESRRSRNSMDKSIGNQQDNSISPKEKTQAIPLFDPNSSQLSDEEDPFAELDKQYHVAVDHNFMEYASRQPSPSQSNVSESHNSPQMSACNTNVEIPIPTTSNQVKKEINSQLQNLAQSPVKLFETDTNTKGNAGRTEYKTEVEVKEEPDLVFEKENLLASEHGKKHSDPHDGSNKKRQIKKEPEHESSASTKSVLQSNTRKRSTDQKPSHRKEKRKRSSQSECQEAAKSIMNMFYTPDDNNETHKAIKNPDASSKTYSDKYVKRKESQKKASKSDDSKKPNSNTSSHSIVSPKETMSETSPKPDTKKKLKPIDIFVTQPPKKVTAHQAHRNTSLITTPPVTNSPDDTKPKLIIPINTSFARKLSKRHIGTQVVLKNKSRETQTNKLKLAIRSTQTDPVTVKSRDVATNPLERMKEIDMEIQLLLQEKFQLYNSLETKTAAIPMDTIPNLSMRVFKVNTEQVEEKSNDSEDTIVDNFTSIPTEELEEIAMETIINEKIPTNSKKNRRQKVAQLTRKSSASPTIQKITKKVKSPNISLIEQIITDDRPLEDIISLDDFEITPVKSKKKPLKTYTPKKKSSKKVSSSKVARINSVAYDLKECSIVLKRIDISHYLKSKDQMPVKDRFTFETPILPGAQNIQPKTDETSIPDSIHHQEELLNSEEASSMNLVVEEVVNDLQFDMLDVSEDIVIGDNCEIKSTDKSKETISEEIILDNSQSSMEDGVPETSGVDNVCKMFDYSNENLRRDAITVTGNADAVLAIECIDNDFIAACLDGNVYHFSGDGQLLNTLRGTNQAVTCLTIVKEKYGTTVYTGSLDSRMRYYDLETGMEKGPECNVLSPIQTMDRAWDTIFVGTRTGFVLQFECKNNMVIPVSTVKFSDQSILALRAMKEGPRKVLLVAARSENVVTVKDAQTGLLLRTLEGPKMTVYTILYEDGKVYCGTSSHNIHVFDYTSGTHVGSHEGGKGAVCLLASGGLVFAGCYDGCVYVFREGEARPLAQLRGPGVMLLSLAIHGTKIIAGYKDRGLYIWKMPLAIVQEMIL